MYVLRPIPQHFLLWALLAPLLLIELIALDGLTAALALSDAARSREAMATLVESRVSTGGPEVRYRLALPQGSFAARNLLDGSEPWIPLSDAGFAVAQRSGQLPVRYLPEDPWVNQPVERIGFGIANSFLLWGMFLTIDLIWLAESFVMLRNLARAHEAVERRHALNVRFWRVRPG